MEISPIPVHDDQTVARLLELERSARAADCPDRPPPCSVSFPVELRQPAPGTDVVHRMVVVDGRIVARLQVWMPTRDNRHLAAFRVVVDPAYRRRGIGRALLEAGIGIARRAGRRTLVAQTLGSWDGGPRRPVAGARFLEAMGFSLALTEVVRRAEVAALAPQTEQALYGEALARAGDYELVSWTGRTPEGLLAGLARLNSAFFEQAPTGEFEFEAADLDTDHLRALDEADRVRGRFRLGVAARHRDSGAVVANTLIAVPTEPGDIAEQRITLVTPAHRGHRLGLLVKLENHRQLRRERPAVRWVYTGNADVNQHMTAINEQLGFTELDTELGYQRAA